MATRILRLVNVIPGRTAKQIADILLEDVRAVSMTLLQMYRLGQIRREQVDHPTRSGKLWRYYPVDLGE